MECFLKMKSASAASTTTATSTSSSITTTTTTSNYAINFNCGIQSSSRPAKITILPSFVFPLLLLAPPLSTQFARLSEGTATLLIEVGGLLCFFLRPHPLRRQQRIIKAANTQPHTMSTMAYTFIFFTLNLLFNDEFIHI